MLQTHIYKAELNCLSLCNSVSVLLQAGGGYSVILLSISSYLHPSDLEPRSEAFATLAAAWSQPRFLLALSSFNYLFLENFPQLHFNSSSTKTIFIKNLLRAETGTVIVIQK